MAKTCLMAKQKRVPKFMARGCNRCRICGRRRGFIRRFEVCRICFRELASKGMLPGVIKASW